MCGLRRWRNNFWYGAPRKGKGSFKLILFGQSASFAYDASPRQIARGIERTFDDVKVKVGSDNTIEIDRLGSRQTITLRGMS